MATGRSGSSVIGALMLVGSFAAILLPSVAGAHDPGLSSSVVTVGRNVVRVIVRVNDADLVGPASPRELLARNAVRVTADGRPLAPFADEVVVASPDHHEIELYFEKTGDAPLVVAVKLLEQMARGHKHHMRIEGGAMDGVSRILSASPVALELVLEP